MVTFSLVGVSIPILRESRLCDFPCPPFFILKRDQEDLNSAIIERSWFATYTIG